MTQPSGTWISLLAIAVMQVAGAQETTERFIPIGESPGVSGIESIIGTIDRVDHDADSMDVRAADEMETVTLDEETRYFLDRSAIGQTNQLGSVDDCKTGRRVEVKVDDDGSADWVKIEDRR